ncbi:MAG: S26 family signal peptidase [Terricaulis sp.]
MRLILVIAAAAALTLAWPAAQPLVIYNHSPSVAIGYYVRSATPPHVGAYVTVRAAAVAPGYAALRRFAGPRDWFIKRVAAVGGAHVCTHGQHVTIGDRVLMRLRHDGQERPLPAWTGCRFLAANEYFLLGDSPDSFDSRYWGPVSAQQIEGVWRRLWATQQED